MKCHRCGGESRVVDSRPLPDGIRRRRECVTCGGRFTTYERRAAAEIKVLKARGRGVEDFQAAKIAAAIVRVSKGIAIALGAAEKIARSIESRLIDRDMSLVRSRQIAMMVAEELVQVSQPAFERFAINYDHSDSEEKRGRADQGERAEQFRLFDESN